MNNIQSQERILSAAINNELVLSVCWWQAVKQDLSEIFAVYLSFATELEEQRKQLLKKVEQASCSPNGHCADEVQSEYLSVWHRR